MVLQCAAFILSAAWGVLIFTLYWLTSHHTRQHGTEVRPLIRCADPILLQVCRTSSVSQHPAKCVQSSWRSSQDSTGVSKGSSPLNCSDGACLLNPVNTPC